MQVIYDHIASVIIAGVILFIFALMQVRGTQSLNETTIHQIVFSDALEAGALLQRDLENMRTEEQTTEAQARGVFSGGAGYECSLTASNDTTYTLTFPTLADPEGAASLVDPMDAPVQLVTYVMEPMADSVAIDRGATIDHLRLFRINRLVNSTFTGGTKPNVVHFSVGLAARGATGFTTGSAGCPDNLAKVRFEIKTAIEGATHVAADQRSTSQLNLSRFATTVDLTNWE